MSELQKPFARWENFDECKREQMGIGHSEESSRKICGAIQARAEKGELYKAVQPLEILKGEGDDLIVGGYASWELIDPQNDYITTEAMVNFLAKFFSLPEEYRILTIDHKNFQIGKALLSYPEKDPKYFSHVHEKGMYLLAKIRNDNLARTRFYREQIRQSIYKMYSISGEPTKKEEVMIDGKFVRKIYDIDPFEVAIVKEGVNPKAEFQILKSKCPPCIEHLQQVYINKGFNEKEALDMAEKLFNRVYERLEKQDEKPPADWWDACIASVEGADPAAVCGHIFHHVLGGDRSRADPGMFSKSLWPILKMTWEECIEQASKDPDVTDPEKLCAWLRWYGPHGQKSLTFQQEVEQIFRKHFPTYKGEK